MSRIGVALVKLRSRCFGRSSDRVPERSSPVDAIVRLLKEGSEGRGASAQAGTIYRETIAPVSARRARKLFRKAM